MHREWRVRLKEEATDIERIVVDVPADMIATKFAIFIQQKQLVCPLIEQY
jgi:hypothetical protein